MNKRFRIPGEQIKQLVFGFGGAMATDRIVVDGCPVGYMYREEPINPQDSGWRFFSGDEDDAYMRDLSRHGVYAVNTIANYDPKIIPWLDSPVGSRLERMEDGTFQAV